MSDSYWGDGLNDIGNCCRKRPTGLFRTGVRLPSTPKFHNGALVATVELLNGIEMTWVQFPYAPPIYGPIVIEAALFVRNERVGERYPAGPPISMGA